MTGYVPSWLFGSMAVAALVGLAGCSVRVAGGVGCGPSRQSEALSGAGVLFLLVGVVASTFRVLGA